MSKLYLQTVEILIRRMASDLRLHCLQKKKKKKKKKKKNINILGSPD